jgi:heat shock protein HslJ
MRHLLALALTLIPAMATAQDMTGTDWQLLAIDGAVVGAEVTATFRIEADGTIHGKAPCNSYGSRNSATLPALSLAGIRATRMACARLKEEQLFFDRLSAMTSVAIEGTENLILTGPDGRSLEFVRDRMNGQARCLTCPPEDQAGGGVIGTSP